jgi:transposase InsO family protein
VQQTEDFKRRPQTCSTANQHIQADHRNQQSRQTIAIDIVGPSPLTQNGNKYLLTFQDTFTKYPDAVAIPDQQASTIAKAFVNNIICRFGSPESITTDLGSNFTSEIFSEICKLLHIKEIHTTAYHPQANGVVERSYQTLMNYLSHFVNKRHDNWDEFVNLALMAYRATPHSVTGYSPYYLMHGREVNLPTELITCNMEPELIEDDYIG